MRYGIFIVDDHALIRRGLRQLFEREPGFHVCGEAASAAEALAALEHLAPDLLITDLTLEGRNGLELTRQLQQHHPDLPVLIVSMHDEHLYAERALAAGARGYIMKRHSDDEIIRAARDVLAGRIYCSPGIRNNPQIGLPFTEPNATSSPLSALTDRELEVFLLIGQGYAPRHIAEKLHLSVSTVEVYRERLKEKLGLKSSPLLLRYAVRWCKDHNANAV